MKIFILGVFMFLVAACTHNPNEIVAVDKGGERFYTDEHAAEALAQGDDESVVCERRIITGSHRVMRVCTTKERKLKDREEGKAQYDQLREKEIRDMMPRRETSDF